MRIKRGEIILKNLQIKSLKKAKKLAKALSVIEIECGIRETKVTIIDPFICPDIDLRKLKDTETEIFLRNLLNEIIKQY